MTGDGSSSRFSATSSVTLRHIAEACGVSRMTVSRALRHLPMVEPGLADRICAKAKELGYQENRALSRLMNATRLSAHGDYLETIALISVGLKSYMKLEHHGVKKQARLFHFKLDEFMPMAEGIQGRRMQSILEARGIRGVILSPSESIAPMRYDLPSGRYHCVLLGKSIRNEGMPRVQHDHYQAGVAAMDQLAKRGYRRPGLIIGIGLHERSWRAYAAAMAAYAPTSVDLAQAIWFKENEGEFDSEGIFSWLRRYQPDVVLVENPYTASLLREFDDALGIIVMRLSGEDGQWAGIEQRSVLIGQESVRLLAGLLLGNESHEYENPPIVNVPGIWREGKSLPSITK